MPELSSLLERTTPDDLDPVDVPAIAASARRRFRRRRIGAGLAAIAAIAVVGTVLVGTTANDRRPNQTVTAESPDTRRLTAGMGTWEQLPDAPFPAMTDLERLPDGRLLAWGNARTRFGDNEDPGDAGWEVAVYDPTERTWTPTETPAAITGLANEQALFAGSRLLLLGMDTQGVYSGTVFDAADGTWTAVPPQPEIKVTLGELAWDGETLVVVRTDPGDAGPVGVGIRPHDVNEPDDGSVELDWRIDAPVTRRWTFGADTWAEGTPPPLSARIAVGDAFDGRRLALIGGTTGPAGTGDESLTRRDGAVYDVAADQWTELPPIDWPAGVHVGVGWIDGQLYAAGGMTSLEGLDGNARRVARLSADGRTWVRLPDSPVEGVAVNGPAGSSLFRTSGGDAAIVRSAPVQFDPADPGGDALIDGRWEATPTQTYDDWDGLVVTTAERMGNGGQRPFTVEVRRSRDDWVATAKAPFTARMQPGVRIAGDRLYVVGGLTGPSLDPDPTFWVLDLSGTR